MALVSSSVKWGHPIGLWWGFQGIPGLVVRVPLLQPQGGCPWGWLSLPGGEGQVCCSSSRGSCLERKWFLAMTLSSSDSPLNPGVAQKLAGVLGPKPLPPPPARFHDRDSSAVHLFLWKPGFLERLQGLGGVLQDGQKDAPAQLLCCGGRAWASAPRSHRWLPFTQLRSGAGPSLPFLCASSQPRKLSSVWFRRGGNRGWERLRNFPEVTA